MKTVCEDTEQDELRDCESPPSGRRVMPTLHGKESLTTERLTLRKDEKLRHKSLIDPLFKEGRTLYDFPLRLTWCAVSSEMMETSFRNAVPENIGPIQILVTVPKKKRRHAVDRVLMRRRIREAYRLNRLPLKRFVTDNPYIRSLEIAIIYLSDKNVPYSIVEIKLKNLLRRVEKTLAYEQARNTRLEE